MNLYFLVEGYQTEKKVYRSWIERVFPKLTKAETLSDVWDDTYRIFSIEGNTDRVDNIKKALDEIERHNAKALDEGRGIFEHLFVCLDTEDTSTDVKTAQVEKLTNKRALPTTCHAIVQNCCFETWFLGNRPMMKRIPEREEFRRMKDFYDVSLNCPEFMQKPPNYLGSIASFHFDYLKEMLRERGVNYSKKLPHPVMGISYLQALIERYDQTAHLQSFGHLLEIWRSIGGKL